VNDHCQFAGFLQDLSATARSVRYAICRCRGTPDDEPSVTSPKHILTMCSWRPTRFEINDWRGRSRVYTKQLGALSLVPAGVCPAFSPRAEFELVMCALDQHLIDEVNAEMRCSSIRDLRLQSNVLDRPAQHLLKLLLSATSHEDVVQNRLYIDYLIHALAIRFLFLAGAIEPSRTAPAPHALPHRTLKRVEERMRGLENDLSLCALAKESGYSKVHFSRMFQAATGQTPHNYVLRLRVERARELLTTSSWSLTEIALECGFSSHSHMTRVFHQFLGVTPSAYRRNL
jgi:AraC family transcriptional regulator